jgi:ABC-type xylose transport system substrate-binding protein
MFTRRKFLAASVAVGSLLATGQVLAQGKGLIGISMPTKSSTRWISDGESMVKEFTALGYETDLQYGEDDIPNQLAQIENMVTKGAKVLIIAAIDGSTLSDILKKAHEAGANDRDAGRRARAHAVAAPIRIERRPRELASSRTTRWPVAAA